MAPWDGAGQEGAQSTRTRSGSRMRRFQNSEEEPTPPAQEVSGQLEEAQAEAKASQLMPNHTDPPSGFGEEPVSSPGLIWGPKQILTRTTQPSLSKSLQSYPNKMWQY